MRTANVFRAVTLNWMRSRSGLFFSFLFPVIFLLLFASIFGGASNSIPLNVQNNDLDGTAPTQLSSSYVAALNSTEILSVSAISSSENATAYVQGQESSFGGNPRLLVIPAGFEANVTRGAAVTLVYMYSPSDQLGGEAGGVVSSVSDSFGLKIAGQNRTIGVSFVSFSARPLQYVDYYMPGLIAAFIMTNGVIGLTSVVSEFRRTRLTKRLSATPLTKLDWILGNVISQTVLALLLSAVMILIAMTLYHSAVSIGVYSVATLVMGSVLFSGIGVALGGLVRDPEAANGLGNAIAFPMMFLSGTFWPVAAMPSYLQEVAKVLPLTYFADGLRDAMILNNASGVLTDLGLVGGLAVAFVVIGAWATRWREP